MVDLALERPALGVIANFDIMRLPDDWFLYRDTDHVMLFYGARLTELAALPIGAQFMSVSSPNPFVHPKSELYPWHSTVSEIRMSVFRPNGQPERGYAQVQRQMLKPWEIEFFEPIWRAICQNPLKPTF